VRAAVVLVVAQFLNPDNGPEPSGDFRVSPTYLIVLLGLGFLIGAAGHLFKSRTLQAAGVLLILAATIFLPIAYSVSR
jgi:hypothetical protein